MIHIICIHIKKGIKKVLIETYFFFLLLNWRYDRLMKRILLKSYDIHNHMNHKIWSLFDQKEAPERLI